MNGELIQILNHIQETKVLMKYSAKMLRWVGSKLANYNARPAAVQIQQTQVLSINS